MCLSLSLVLLSSFGGYYNITLLLCHLAGMILELKLSSAYKGCVQFCSASAPSVLCYFFRRGGQGHALGNFALEGGVGYTAPSLPCVCREQFRRASGMFLALMMYCANGRLESRNTPCVSHFVQTFAAVA